MPPSDAAYKKKHSHSVVDAIDAPPFHSELAYTCSQRATHRKTRAKVSGSRLVAPR